MIDGFTDMERADVRRELITCGMDGTDFEVDSVLYLAKSGGVS